MGSPRVWQQVLAVFVVALALMQSEWLQCGAVRPLFSDSVKNAQLPVAYNTSAVAGHVSGDMNIEIRYVINWTVCRVVMSCVDS